MIGYLRHVAREIGLNDEDKRAAEVALGPRHRLTRAVWIQHALTVQMLVTATALLAGVAGVVAHVSRSAFVVASAAIVEAALVLAWWATRRVARTVAHELIAVGDDEVPVEAVVRERRRLASAVVRERLAGSLAAVYQDACRWSRMHPHFRPLPGVVQLRHLSRETDDVVTLLRRPRVRIRGVALTERLLTDGGSSPLYADDVEALREELNRIRYLLGTDTFDARSDARRAA
jgi:hypothetical protein